MGNIGRQLALVRDLCRGYVRLMSCNAKYMTWKVMTGLVFVTLLFLFFSMNINSSRRSPIRTKESHHQASVFAVARSHRQVIRKHLHAAPVGPQLASEAYRTSPELLIGRPVLSTGLDSVIRLAHQADQSLEPALALFFTELRWTIRLEFVVFPWYGLSL